VESSVLQVEAIVETLQIYFRTPYFQVVDKFIQQKDSKVMGSFVSPIASNIFMEHFEKQLTVLRLSPN
jgi:hypothetical protein